MTQHILADTVASITELKKHPLRTVNSAYGDPIAILSNNKAVFYCVPTAKYEAMMDVIDDARMMETLNQRVGEKAVAVNIHDL